MCQINTLSYNTIKIECECRELKISTEDEFIFDKDYLRYNKNDVIKVEPYIEDNNKYYLKIWSNEYSISYLDQDGICNLFCNNILKDIDNKRD